MQCDVFFVTSNEKKYREVKKILSYIKRLDIDTEEIRDNNFEKVVISKLLSDLKKTNKEGIIIVEDSGLEIEALNNFPGTFSKWSLEKIGLEGIIKLMEGEKHRDAKMIALVAAYIPNKGIIIEKGVVEGYIAENIRGDKGMMYDKIFIPKGYSNTFAEKIELKERLSHRSLAFNKIKKVLEEYINTACTSHNTN